MKKVFISLSKKDKRNNEFMTEQAKILANVNEQLREPVIVDWLISDGWTVEYNPGSQNAALQVVIPVKDGTLTGHPDCIISKGEIQNALDEFRKRLETLKESRTY